MDLITFWGSNFFPRFIMGGFNDFWLSVALKETPFVVFKFQTSEHLSNQLDFS